MKKMEDKDYRLRIVPFLKKEPDYEYFSSYEEAENRLIEYVLGSGSWSLCVEKKVDGNWKQWSRAQEGDVITSADEPCKAFESAFAKRGAGQRQIAAAAFPLDDKLRVGSITFEETIERFPVKPEWHRKLRRQQELARLRAFSDAEELRTRVQLEDLRQQIDEETEETAVAVPQKEVAELVPIFLYVALEMESVGGTVKFVDTVGQYYMVPSGAEGLEAAVSHFRRKVEEGLLHGQRISENSMTLTHLINPVVIDIQSGGTN